MNEGLGDYIKFETRHNPYNEDSATRTHFFLLIEPENKFLIADKISQISDPTEFQKNFEIIWIIRR